MLELEILLSGMNVTRFCSCPRSSSFLPTTSVSTTTLYNWRRQGEGRVSNYVIQQRSQGRDDDDDCGFRARRRAHRGESRKDGQSLRYTTATGGARGAGERGKGQSQLYRLLTAGGGEEEGKISQSRYKTDDGKAMGGRSAIT